MSICMYILFWFSLFSYCQTITFIKTFVIGYIRCGLDDFGGDFGEYLSLLKGNSVLTDFTSGVPGGGGTDDIGKGQVHFKLKT